MAKTKAKPYKGFLAKPRKLSPAEKKRAAGLPMTQEERDTADSDAHGHWGLIFEKLCTEYGLKCAQASMKVLWMRMAKRHVPAARDLAISPNSGAPRRLDAAGQGLADLVDRMIGHLAGAERTEASLRIAREMWTLQNPGSPVSMATIRIEARQMRNQSRMRLSRRNKATKK